MTNRNLGRFKFSYVLLDSNIEQVAEVFKIMECVPVRAESLWASEQIDYIAYSKLFEEVPENCIVPEYTIHITKSESGGVESVEVTKKS